MNYKLFVKKYKQQGDIAWQYHPLRNFKKGNGEICDFRIKNSESKFHINLENPIDIECQPSYDGTVNLYLNDGANPPRVLNTRWTKTDNNTFKIINREQINQSNIYREEYVDRETRLFRNVDGVTKIDLHNITHSGKLKVGNYIIYMKYMDDDYNETDIVAQTGVISIFNGNISSPKTVSGGLMDEETDKSISLEFRDLDTSFSYFKLYVYRTTCDSNGVKIDYAYKIDDDYEITNTSKLVYINGFEDTIDISVEELNIQYNIVDSVKSQAQVQNMLFFANTSKPKDYSSTIQEISLYIHAKEEISNQSVGYINPENYKPNSLDDAWQTEYYSPLNIYYRLGYWPDEWYRFGIVYIYNDDHLSPVYNLRGCDFSANKENYDSINEKYDENNIENNKKDISSYWINTTRDKQNSKGVFRFSKCYNEIVNHKDNSITPVGVKFTLPVEVVKALRKENIKGFFFVRQPRIPTILCQGYSIGVNDNCYIPMLNYNGDYIAESFLTSDLLVTKQNTSKRILKTKYKQSSGLLCVDAYLSKQLQSMFDTSEFKIEKVCRFSERNKEDGKLLNNGLDVSKDLRHYWHVSDNAEATHFESSHTNLLYIDTEIPQKVFDDKGFSTKAGMQEDLQYLGYFNGEGVDEMKGEYIRGIFTSFIGTNADLEDNCLYNIRVKNFDESFAKEYFEIRMNDNSSFYAISPRYDLTPKIGKVDCQYIKNDSNEEEYYDVPVVFGGDCFTNTVTTRMHRNFTSSSVPINDTIIDTSTWKENFNGLKGATEWNKINKADIDAVPIGHWMTYKCMSNYNTGLRCVDPFQIEEQALMGNPRSFYPLQGISTKSSNKIPESNLMNDGYNSLLGVKRNFSFEIVPYVKDIFDTRIMFSNIQVDGAFKNSYKVFQGLSYEDIDRQYGSIVKILPWGVNLFCVFEHGLAIIPVNEKALLQTTQGANIHMYGTGVLQKQVVLISDTVGSRWKDSIIKTPIGIYGVDADNHKIWRYTDDKKLEIISDFKIQRYLHDNIDLKESDKFTILGSRNIKTHYNAFKGDIMFTYYNKDRIWNICYNEHIGKWITRYSWTPLMSENIDHSMFSFDLLKTRIFGLINTNLGRNNKDSFVTIKQFKEDGSEVFDNSCVINDKNDLIFDLSIKEPYTYYNIDSIKYKGFYWNEKTNMIDFDYLESDSSIISNIYGTTDKELYESYDNLKPRHKIVLNHKSFDDKYLYFNIDIRYTPYTVAEISNDGFNIEEESTIIIGNNTLEYTIGIIKSEDYFNGNKDHWNNALLNSIFVHGRSINADEIDYFDSNRDNQCQPTKWYDAQHQFEFEIVVSEPKGSHKIFDNLMIISNNVEPESLEVEITGDVYGYDKLKIKDNMETLFPKINVIEATESDTAKVIETKLKWHPIENEYTFNIHQDMINIKKYGRRLGNIYYNEDKWYITLKPIYFRDLEGGSLRSTRIRDKYAKIRVKYSGEKLAVIVALQTMFTLSYV